MLLELSSSLIHYFFAVSENSLNLFFLYLLEIFFRILYPCQKKINILLVNSIRNNLIISST